jgi:shikimate 5-dehydrogenase
VIEVHISNVHRREAFRHHSYVSAVAEAVICGCGTEGYLFALQRLATLCAGSRPMSRPSFLIGLIGQGIGGSLSPAMHEEEGFRQGYGYVYRRIDLDALGVNADALPQLLDAAQQMGYNGLNITHPCKQRVIEHLDALSDDARALGAVNTVLFKDGKRIGHNTDWSGFARSFRRGLPDASLARVVQLGAGGAGAAVAHAALQMGAAELRSSTSTARVPSRSRASCSSASRPRGSRPATISRPRCAPRRA